MWWLGGCLPGCPWLGEVSAGQAGAACLALPSPSGNMTAPTFSGVTSIASFHPQRYCFSPLDITLLFALFLCNCLFPSGFLLQSTGMLQG